MHPLKRSIPSVTSACAGIVLATTCLRATDYFWSGTVDSTFSNSSNWSPVGFPGANDKGVFFGPGNGNTVISMEGANVTGIVVSNATVAAYTFGSGAVGSQTFRVQNNFQVNATAGQTQTVNANIRLSGALTLTSQITDGLRVAGVISITGTTARVLQINGNGSGTISGAIADGAAVLSLAKANTGTWTLADANTYTGPTIVGNGVLAVSSVAVEGGASGLGNATSPITLGTASASTPTTGTLHYTGDTATMVRGLVLATPGTGTLAGRLNVATEGTTLTLSGGVDNSVGGSGKAALFTVGGAGDTVIDGVVGGGSGGLTKADGGTLTLNGDNTYTGATTLSANGGVLLVNGNQTAANGSVTVGTGATLGGSGIIGGATTLNGTLSPGALAGTLTFAGNLAVSPGATCAFEAGDLVVVDGALDLDDNWTLALGDGFQDGGSVTLFNYGSLGASPDLAPTIDVTHLGFAPTHALSLSDTGTSIVLNGIRLPLPPPTTITIR